MARLLLCCGLILCVLISVKASQNELLNKLESLPVVTTHLHFHKATALAKCYIKFMKFVATQDADIKVTLPTDSISRNKLSKEQILDIAGSKALKFCEGYPIYLMNIYVDSNQHVGNNVRKKRYVRRHRGQTQSQYLNVGTNAQPGKAEAEATPDSTKAVVSGNSGMGQAQSQSNPYGCDECYNQQQGIHQGSGGTGSQYKPEPISYPNQQGIAGQTGIQQLQTPAKQIPGHSTPYQGQTQYQPQGINGGYQNGANNPQSTWQPSATGTAEPGQTWQSGGQHGTPQTWQQPMTQHGTTLQQPGTVLQHPGTLQSGPLQQPGTISQYPGTVQPGTSQHSGTLQQPGSQHPGALQPGTSQVPGTLQQPGSILQHPGTSQYPGTLQPGTSQQPGSILQHPGTSQHAGTLQPGTYQQPISAPTQPGTYPSQSAQTYQVPEQSNHHYPSITGPGYYSQPVQLQGEQQPNTGIHTDQQRRTFSGSFNGQYDHIQHTSGSGGRFSGVFSGQYNPQSDLNNYQARPGYSGISEGVISGNPANLGTPGVQYNPSGSQLPYQDNYGSTLPGSIGTPGHSNFGGTGTSPVGVPSTLTGISGVPSGAEGTTGVQSQPQSFLQNNQYGSTRPNTDQYGLQVHPLVPGYGYQGSSTNQGSGNYLPYGPQGNYGPQTIPRTQEVPTQYGNPTYSQGTPTGAYGTPNSGIGNGYSATGTNGQPTQNVGSYGYGNVPSGTGSIPSNLQTGAYPYEDADDADSQVQTSVQQTNNETQASASALGKYAGSDVSSHVSGTYTGSGSFSASAGSNDGKKGAQTQVSGGSEGATSSAQGQGGSGQSQAQVKLVSETGETISMAQSGGIDHGTNTQVQAGVKGGLADAQANGPGSTSSQAQIGFTPHEENEEDDQDTPFRGGGTAAAQGGRNYGQTQVQLQGKFRFGIKYTGSAQAGSGNNQSTVQNRNQTQFTFGNAFPTLKPLVFNAVNQSHASQTSNSSKVHSKQTNTTARPHRTNKPRTTTSLPPHHEDEYTDEYNDYDENPPQEQTGPQQPPESNAPILNKVPPEQEEESSNTNLVSNGQEEEHVHPPTAQEEKNPLEDLDATVTQAKGNELEHGTVIQSGQTVPGSNGYKIPQGFRGVVKSVSNGRQTSAIGSNSQAQTVSLKPGSGKITYRKPLYGVASTTQTRNGRYSFGSGYTIQPSYQLRSGVNNPKFVSLTKSEIGSQDAITGEKTPSLYYSQSSSCGYFTNTCVYHNGIKICTPKPKVNADGTPIVC